MVTISINNHDESMPVEKLLVLAAARELFPHASPCLMRDSYHTVNEAK